MIEHLYGKDVNFDPLLQLIHLILLENREGLKNDLSLKPVERQIIAHKVILRRLLEPGEDSREDYTDTLLNLAINNEKVSKHLAK